MATCTYVCEETSREPDNHEGNHHGGGKHRTPVLAGLLLAAFNASQCLVGIRNMHKEMGITVNAPTTLYCDCDPAIKVVSGVYPLLLKSTPRVARAPPLPASRSQRERSLCCCSLD